MTLSGASQVHTHKHTHTHSISPPLSLPFYRAIHLKSENRILNQSKARQYGLLTDRNCCGLSEMYR